MSIPLFYSWLMLIVSSWIMLSVVSCQDGGELTRTTAASPRSGCLDDSDEKCSDDDSSRYSNVENSDNGDNDDGDDTGASDFLSSLLGGSGAGLESGLNSGGVSGSDGGDPNVVSYISGRKGPYISGSLNVPGETLVRDSFNHKDGFFHCPGDAFLIGLQAVFDPETGDRVFKAVCQFFQTGDGHHIKKKANSCKTTSRPYNTAGQTSASFSCEEKTFLTGIRAVFSEAKHDRLLQFECCQMTTWDDRPLKLAPTEPGTIAHMSCNQRIPITLAQIDQNLVPFLNDEVNSLRQPLEFQCAQNMMLKTIRSTYVNGRDDRRYSFRCCPLMIE